MKEDNYTLSDNDFINNNPKNIKKAKFAGFCHGVKRAVETVKKIKFENSTRDVFVLGELIHNAHVISELESLGIKTLKSIPEKGDGICVIRTHGESPEIIERIKNSGFEVVDMTCPDVKKAQQKAIELAENGYYTIIVGKAEHPEVAAIKANAKLYSDDVIVAASVDDVKKYENEIKSFKRVGLVVQTTQKVETLKEIVDYIIPLVKEIHVENTICQSTAMRQKEARELAQESDLVIVVGSKKSANTTHLAEILKNITSAIHIENADELNKYANLVKNSQNISVTAGASTPQDVIDEVINCIKSK